MSRPRRIVVALLALAAVAPILGCDRGENEELPDPLVISAGSPSGIYHGYGERLGDEMASALDLEVEVLPTDGSVDNLQDLADGRADIAFSTVDAAADAVAGVGDFDEPLEVSALARIYDDFVHLVVLDDSAVRSVRDLRNRTVSLGASGSGTAVIADRLLAAAELPRSQVDVRMLGLTESVAALRRGEVDAFFWSGGLGTPGLSELADEVPIRLVPLAGAVRSLRAEHRSGYRHGRIPEGTYGLTEDVATVAVPNVLMVRNDLPAPVAERVLATVFDAGGRIASDVPAATLLDPVKAIFTEPVDLHPGAVTYYRDAQGLSG
ncbi:TAXI family TRAP transporter solute-binding subunit [Georgenia alba]|uniref:TAXI family TRAP transporter solute-binding subunit n=1 Tax=Georgenia alba TaxID=2233858 RepID=A0ABW2Q4Q2_9MICO